MPKLSELTALTGPNVASADLLLLDDVSVTTSKSVRADNLLQGLLVASTKAINDENGNAWQKFTTVGSAVNWFNVTNAATGGAVKIAPAGGDAAIPINVDAKGAGAIVVGGTSTGLVSLGRGSTKATVFSSTKTAIGTQNSTPTAAQLLGGYISHTSVTGAGTATLDTAANLDTAISGVANGDSFECTYSNIGTQTVTVQTAAGLSLKGTLAIPTLKTATLYFYRTGAGAWDVVVSVSA